MAAQVPLTSYMQTGKKWQWGVFIGKRAFLCRTFSAGRFSAFVSGWVVLLFLLKWEE